MTALAIIAPSVTAIVVAVLAFRFALRQDSRRFFREQRSQLYIDILADSHAELVTHQYRLTAKELNAISPDQPDERFRPPQTTMLNDHDRRLLGARAAAYSSLEVRQLWNAFGGVCARAILVRPEDAAAVKMKGKAEEAFAALETRIVQEIAKDR
jgi:hypothetical protein